MGILSKLATTASTGITVGAVTMKTASQATFTAFDASLHTSKMFSEFAFK